MYVWDRQKEIQVFVVLFRIRLFPCSYAETSEREQVPMSFLSGLNLGLSPLSISVTWDSCQSFADGILFIWL